MVQSRLAAGIAVMLFGQLFATGHLRAQDKVVEVLSANTIRLASGTEVTLPDIRVALSLESQAKQRTWLELFVLGREVRFRDAVRLGPGRYQAEVIWNRVAIGKTVQKMYDSTTARRAATPPPPRQVFFDSSAVRYLDTSPVCVGYS